MMMIPHLCRQQVVGLARILEVSRNKNRSDSIPSYLTTEDSSSIGGGTHAQRRQDVCDAGNILNGQLERRVYE